MNDQTLAAVSVPMPDRHHHSAASAAVAQANALLVRNNDEYLGATTFLKDLKAGANRIEEERKKLKAPILEAGKAIDRFFGAPLELLAGAESTVKRKLVVYDQEQERRRRDEQRKADEKARKEREELERKAAEALAAGRLERAAQLEERAASAVAPIIDRAPPKVAGVSYREVWKFEVVNADLVPRQYLSIDESKIRKVVQGLKGDTRIEGVRVYMEKEIAAGAS